MLIAFLFFLFSCACVFPAVTFFSDYMEAQSFDARARWDYIGFTAFSTFSVTFMAFGVYYLSRV
jgi:hypothetical protein